MCFRGVSFNQNNSEDAMWCACFACMSDSMGKRWCMRQHFQCKVKWSHMTIDAIVGFWACSGQVNIVPHCDSKEKGDSWSPFCVSYYENKCLKKKTQVGQLVTWQNCRRTEQWLIVHNNRPAPLSLQAVMRAEGNSFPLSWLLWSVPECFTPLRLRQRAASSLVPAGRAPSLADRRVWIQDVYFNMNAPLVAGLWLSNQCVSLLDLCLKPFIASFFARCLSILRATLSER